MDATHYAEALAFLGLSSTLFALLAGKFLPGLGEGLGLLLEKREEGVCPALVLPDQGSIEERPRLENAVSCREVTLESGQRMLTWLGPAAQSCRRRRHSARVPRRQTRTDCTYSNKHARAVSGEAQ